MIGISCMSLIRQGQLDGGIITDGYAGRELGLEGMHVGLELFDESPVDAVEGHTVVGGLPAGDPVPVGFHFHV